MSVVSAADLARMQADALLLMPDTCTIVDPGTPSTTASGGTTIATPVTYADVPCRLSRTGTQSVLSEFGAQLTSEADYLLTVQTTATVREGWAVTVNGTTYAITAVARGGSWPTATRCLVRERVAVGG